MKLPRPSIFAAPPPPGDYHQPAHSCYDSGAARNRNVDLGRHNLEREFPHSAKGDF
jgi:hypothetical protein